MYECVGFANLKEPMLAITFFCHENFLRPFFLLLVCSPGARSAASIILRGANDFMVDEMERSVHDALCVVKRVLESQQVVAGGGAVEAALSIFLENLATSIVSVI